MTNRTMTAAILILLPTMFTGCTEQHRDTQEFVAVVKQFSFDDVWTACLASLKDHGFTVDRQDRRFGVIVSEPLVGKQFFEFWRNDAVTLDDTMTSSLHTIRRTVSIQVVSQGPKQFEVSVEAQAQRSSVPSEQLDNPAEAFEMLRAQGVPASPTRHDYARPQAEPVWVDIGREYALERYILEDIARRLRKG